MFKKMFLHILWEICFKFLFTVHMPQSIRLVAKKAYQLGNMYQLGEYQLGHVYCIIFFKLLNVTITRKMNF